MLIEEVKDGAYARLEENVENNEPFQLFENISPLSLSTIFDFLTSEEMARLMSTNHSMDEKALAHMPEEEKDALLKARAQYFKFFNDSDIRSCVWNGEELSRWRILPTVGLLLSSLITMICFAMKLKEMEEIADIMIGLNVTDWIDDRHFTPASNINRKLLKHGDHYNLNEVENEIDQFKLNSALALAGIVMSACLVMTIGCNRQPCQRVDRCDLNVLEEAKAQLRLYKNSRRLRIAQADAAIDIQPDRQAKRARWRPN